MKTLINKNYRYLYCVLKLIKITIGDTSYLCHLFITFNLANRFVGTLFGFN